jgi:phosphatidylserine/phosphatidylglycerophosphate/cardiolipin synthase-like enzyme
MQLPVSGRRGGLLALALVALLSPSCRLTKQIQEQLGELDPMGSGSRSQPGSIRAYFTTPDNQPERPGNIADKLAGYIDQARESIDVAGFEIDNAVLTEALVQAHQRGVKVRVVTDSDYLEERGPKALRAVQVPVVGDDRQALMHNKFMVFDQRAVWTGSMNFTENCAYRNDNNGVLVLDRNLAENYRTKFRWMFENRKFGGKPAPGETIPNPRVTLADGTEVENYFSTHDGVAEKVIAEIERARKSVRILAFSFTHEKIGDVVLAAAKQGVEVEVVFEKSQAAGKWSQYSRMQSAGLKVDLDGNSRNMHHKCMIIDAAIVITGSFNFSSNADKSNDENLLVIRNKKLATRFEEEFRRVRDVAQRASEK